MPDARHFRDQKYCTKDACRRASKSASQRRWLLSAKGAEYRDPAESKRRVRLWRALTPGYWKRTVPKVASALRETMTTEPVVNEELNAGLVPAALQDMTFSQPALVVGLIASLTGNSLQETIVESARRFVLLGQDILGNGPGSYSKGNRRNANDKTNSLSGTSAPCPENVQLGRSPPRARSAHQPMQP